MAYLLDDVMIYTGAALRWRDGHYYLSSLPTWFVFPAIRYSVFEEEYDSLLLFHALLGLLIRNSTQVAIVMNHGYRVNEVDLLQMLKWSI
jgi:hypothetical protein